jgi:hypothetical protein
MDTSEKSCLVCQRTDQEIPLIVLEYQGQDLRICPQHMPILIHNPTELTGKLSGAEGMSPADHND